MTTQPRDVDVVLIGLGAAGGIAAHVLTEAGMEVVALEAGPRVDASMMTLDEIRNDVRSWLSRPKSAGEIPTWRTDPSEPSVPSPWPMLMVNAVGGTTVHYDCASLRLHPWHFAARTRVTERYGPDAIPSDSTLADWPVSYDELEPYYGAVEYAIGVSGAAGNLGGTLNPRGNVFEGPRSRDYPMPPVHPSGFNELMSEAATRLGWHPFQVPSAINSRPYNGNAECTSCGFCLCNGCYRDAKGSTDVTVIRKAEATGRLAIETEARAIRIEVDAEGLVSGVRYVKDGRELVQPARAVLLGGFVYENTRLLLLSRSKAYPNGLANNHGQVGKHYVAHLQPFAFGVFPGRRLNRFSGSGAQITCVDDWNADNFDHSELGFLGGGLLMALQELKPIQVSSDPLPPGIPRWGSSWKGWLKQHAQSVGSATVQLEALPYEGNVLELDPTAKDPFGMPVVRVTHRLREHERRASNFMRAKLELWLSAAGASETWSKEEVFVETRHPYGGTRMGDDPDASVVDRYGFAHEVPNLGIIGASTFPTTGGHNPTLTLQALAWRTAEHLATRESSASLRH